ncbi:uncharacterized protein BJ171DRAFT_514724 [Polychytrium aggregatum]|uniref:uncharacterized protein n=1 Tax=Polychytrium aggregatum TaxID=110093 RepID=UPI0022FE499F|nr:uncharacterized protein BJ171DRAFT_514724 [Polychytrium aggregatum]KAI9202329.1 hypothetical protein BJ171DRAFT_514724 [Polychytrium aggregatum]
MEDDGFALVRKGRKSSKPGSKPSGRARPGSSSNTIQYRNVSTRQNQPKDPESVKKGILDAVEEKRSLLARSPFFQQAMDSVATEMKAFRSSSGDLDIVCYGIGSLAGSRISQLQFALCLLLHEIYSFRHLYIFDPIMSEMDRAIADHFNLTVIDTNERGKRTVSRPTLFYMPHCGAALYNNVLWANWGASSLTNIAIIGNSFDMYCCSSLDSKLAAEGPFIKTIQAHTTEVALPSNFHDNDVFNNLSFHFFRPSSMDAIDVLIWENAPEPALTSSPEIL